MAIERYVRAVDRAKYRTMCELILVTRRPTLGLSHRTLERFNTVAICLFLQNHRADGVHELTHNEWKKKTQLQRGRFQLICEVRWRPECKSFQLYCTLHFYIFTFTCLFKNVCIFVSCLKWQQYPAANKWRCINLSYIFYSALLPIRFLESMSKKKNENEKILHNKNYGPMAGYIPYFATLKQHTRRYLLLTL